MFLSLVVVWIPFGEDLGGVTHNIQTVEASSETVLSGEYSTYIEREMEHNLPSRPGFIRLYNQGLFDLFKTTNTELVIAPDGTLFEEYYLQEYADSEPLTANLVDSIAENVALWADRMSDSGRTVYFTILPSKPRYYASSIPEKYSKGANNNCHRIEQALRSHNLNIIDTRGTLDSLSKETPYLIFPKYGIHWSRLGYSYAFDYFLSIIDTLSDQNSYIYSVDKVEADNGYKNRERDLWQVLNTWSDAPYDSPVGRPITSFEVTGKKHGLLVIGDSFYWSWYGTGLTLSQFEPSYFFYYNATAHKAGTGEIGPVTPELTQQVLSEVDVVVVLLNEANISLVLRNNLDSNF